MKKKIILRLSNEIGNQMFMYASALSISKKMNRELLLDNETAFLLKKNISKYGLNNFKITAKIADENFKFKKLKGYIKRKFLHKIDLFKKDKTFYQEPKNKKKITSFNNDFINRNFSDVLYLEGHFESEKYFFDYKNNILNEFEFIDSELFKKNYYYDKILNTNAVGICLRQNRFNEGKGRDNQNNRIKSQKYTNQQIEYINKSASIIKKKIKNPIFYIWSNDLENINFNNFEFHLEPVNLNSTTDVSDIRALSLFLLSQCKHFITIPSTFNWWGAWLSKNKNKIIIRPKNEFFSDFYVNNLDFWPKNWLSIGK